MKTIITTNFFCPGKAQRLEHELSNKEIYVEALTRMSWTDWMGVGIELPCLNLWRRIRRGILRSFRHAADHVNVTVFTCHIDLAAIGR